MDHRHNHCGLLYEDTHSHGNVREYKNYCYLFIISIIGALAEFIIALFYAHSSSAQADAIHALTHVALFAIAYGVSKKIVTRNMNTHEAYHYHEKFLNLYAILVFTGLTWVLYTSIIKLWSYEYVVTKYMLISVSVGLCANIIALLLLNSMSKIRGSTSHQHRAHQWLNLDTWGDLAFSVIVLFTSVISLMIPSLPLHYIDPIISLGAVIWIAWSGIQIFKHKTSHPFVVL